MKTLKEFTDTIIEGQNIASFQNGTPEGKTVSMTSFSRGKGNGKGIQITAGPKNFVQLTPESARTVGKMLIKWAEFGR